MEKEPITNILGLKALAWDIDEMSFVSPARKEFIWSPGGLQMGDCYKCGNEPREDCRCGLYATFDHNIVLEYTHESIISPIFLVEASGITHFYTDGFRSRELTIHAVVPSTEEANSWVAAQQAAYYFKVPVREIEEIYIAMDLHNKKLFPEEYKLRTRLSKLAYELGLVKG